MRKAVGTRSLLSNTIKDATTIMRTPLPEYVGRHLHLLLYIIHVHVHAGERVHIVVPSILDSNAKGTSCSHDFSHTAPLHHYNYSFC